MLQITAHEAEIKPVRTYAAGFKIAELLGTERRRMTAQAAMQL